MGVVNEQRCVAKQTPMLTRKEKQIVQYLPAGCHPCPNASIANQRFDAIECGMRHPAAVAFKKRNAGSTRIEDRLQAIATALSSDHQH